MKYVIEDWAGNRPCDELFDDVQSGLDYMYENFADEVEDLYVVKYAKLTVQFAVDRADYFVPPNGQTYSGRDVDDCLCNIPLFANHSIEDVENSLPDGVTCESTMEEIYAMLHNESYADYQSKMGINPEDDDNMLFMIVIDD